MSFESKLASETLGEANSLTEIDTLGDGGHTVHHHLDTVAQQEIIYPEAGFWR